MAASKQQRTLRQFADKFSEDKVTTQSAALAFYTTLAVAPSLLLVLTLLSVLAPGTQERVVGQMVELGGSEIEPFVQTLLASAGDKPNLRRAAGWISFALLLLSASALFAQLQAAMNRVWRAQAEQLSGLWATIHRRLYSILMLLILVVISIASMIAQAMLPPGSGIWLVVGWIVGLAIFTALFAAMYRFLPDQRVAWSTAFRGGAITAVMFMLGRAAIGVYLAYSNVAGAFGAFGSMIIWLLWVYYVGIVFLAAAVLTLVLAQRRGWAWFEDGDAPVGGDDGIRSG